MYSMCTWSTALCLVSRSQWSHGSSDASSSRAVLQGVVQYNSIQHWYEGGKNNSEVILSSTASKNIGYNLEIINIVNCYGMFAFIEEIQKVTSIDFKYIPYEFL